MKKVLKTLMLIIGIILALFVVLVIVDLVSGSSSENASTSDMTIEQTIIKEVVIDGIRVDTDKRNVIITWIDINKLSLDESNVSESDSPDFEEKGILAFDNVDIEGYHLGEPDEMITQLSVDDEPIVHLSFRHTIEISSTPKNGYYDVYKVTPLESLDDYMSDLSEGFAFRDNGYETIALDFAAMSQHGIVMIWRNENKEKCEGVIFDDGLITQDIENEKIFYNGEELIVGEFYRILLGDSQNGMHEVCDIYPAYYDLVVSDD